VPVPGATTAILPFSLLRSRLVFCSEEVVSLDFSSSYYLHRTFLNFFHTSAFDKFGEFAPLHFLYMLLPYQRPCHICAV
jgi:hypothetical protein